MTNHFDSKGGEQNSAKATTPSASKQDGARFSLEKGLKVLAMVRAQLKAQ